MTRARVFPQSSNARSAAGTIVAVAAALLTGSALAAAQSALPVVDGLRVTAELSVVDGPPSGPRVAASYEGADSSGNTSVANDPANTFKWSGTSSFTHGDWGYFTPEGMEVPYIKRDRDLGQTLTYTGDRPARLDAITLRTGFGSGVVRPGTFGQAVSIQIFEVTGRPALNDNGTTGATSALHGFPHDRRSETIPAERDDYLTGESYRPLALVTGARFPSKADFGLAPSASVDPGHPKLKGRYLRWDLQGGAEVMLEPGRSYAFLIMIDQAGDDRGFTLANHYRGSYPGGHGIRRDGNGVFPPAPADPTRDFTDPANAAARAAARFPADMAARAAIPPGTNGYPDVDTWRDLVFWVEVSVPDRDR